MNKNVELVAELDGLQDPALTEEPMRKRAQSPSGCSGCQPARSHSTSNLEHESTVTVIVRLLVHLACNVKLLAG